MRRLMLACATLIGMMASGNAAHAAACSPTNAPPGSVGCQPALPTPIQSTDMMLAWRPSLFPNSLGTYTMAQLATYFASATGFVVGPNTSTIGDIPYFGTNNGTVLADSGILYSSIIAVASPVQGDVIYYNGTAWIALVPGSSGQFLQTQGASANPVWASAGSVSAITALTGDVTAAGPGSAAAALATVNSNVGTYQGITVNGKGLVTAAGPGQVDLATSALTRTFANASSGGTTTGLIVKQTSTGLKNLLTTDTNVPVAGICLSGCGTTGSATTATGGAANCVFDNATTQSDYVVASTTSAGECHDAGSTLPINVNIIGLTASTNGGAGTYAVELGSFGAQQAASSVSTTGSMVNGNLPKATGAATLADSGIVATNVAQGPASAVSGNLPSFNGTGGKTLQDSGVAASSVVTTSTSQTANTVLAAPNGSSGGPSFRAIVAADLPADTAYLDQTQSFTKAQRGTPATLSISTATFTPSFDAAQNFSITLVHASCPCTVANPSTTPVAGQSGMIAVAQSATGSDTIGTWGTDYKFASATPPTLSTAANAVDFFPYYVFSTSQIIVGAGVLNAH